MPSHPHSTSMLLQSRGCILQVLRFSLAWPKLLSHGACSGPSNGHEVESIYILAPQADLQETEIPIIKRTTWEMESYGGSSISICSIPPTLTFLIRRLHNSNLKRKSNWFCPQQRLSKSTCIRVPPLKNPATRSLAHIYIMQPLVSLHKFLMW